MPLTPDLGLPYPGSGDPADVPADLAALALQLDGIAGAPSGLATLDATGKLPEIQLLLPQLGATVRQALTWNGSEWEPAPVTPVVARATAAATVASSIVETPLFSFVVPGGMLATDRTLRLVALADYLKGTDANAVKTWRLKLGGTTLATVQLNTQVTEASRGEVRVEAEIANLGSASSQRAALKIDAMRSDFTMYGRHALASALGTKDTGSNQTLELTFQWSVAAANNSYVQRYARLELL